MSEEKKQRLKEYQKNYLNIIMNKIFFNCDLIMYAVIFICAHCNKVIF